MVPCERCYHYGFHTTTGLDWWFDFWNKTCLSHGRIIKKEGWCFLTQHPQDQMSAKHTCVLKYVSLSVVQSWKSVVGSLPSLTDYATNGNRVAGSFFYTIIVYFTGDQSMIMSMLRDTVATVLLMTVNMRLFSLMLQMTHSAGLHTIHPYSPKFSFTKELHATLQIWKCTMHTHWVACMQISESTENFMCWPLVFVYEFPPLYLPVWLAACWVGYAIWLMYDWLSE